MSKEPIGTPVWSPEMERRSLELDAAALPGPWFVVPSHLPDGGLRRYDDPELLLWRGRDDDQSRYTVSDVPDQTGWETDGGYTQYGIHRQEAEFIAHARFALPAAVGAIQNLRLANEALAARCKELEREIAEYAIRAQPGPSASEERAARRPPRRKK